VWKLGIREKKDIATFIAIFIAGARADIVIGLSRIQSGVFQTVSSVASKKVGAGT